MNDLRMPGGQRWRHFSHRADIGVEGRGRTPAEAFEAAALALTAVVTDPALVQPRERVEIQCQAPDLELLLADWLNALVYEMSAQGMLFGRFEITLEDNCLRATAWGEPIDPERHKPAVEIKGATYTELSVRQEGDGDWVARCVVDV